MQEYSTCESWDELVAGKNFKYVPAVRVSDPGSDERPVYTGFWFYDEQQFDITGRYALGMKVYFQERDVELTDKGDIGYFDLKDGFNWTKIGETTAWNWQQGCRLQWRPNSDEILWNDRSDDGTHFICRVYNFKTGENRIRHRKNGYGNRQGGISHKPGEDGRYCISPKHGQSGPPCFGLVNFC